MRRFSLCPLACLLICALLPARAETMSRAQIIAEGEKVAGAQLAQLAGALEKFARPGGTGGDHSAAHDVP